MIAIGFNAAARLVSTLHVYFMIRIGIIFIIFQHQQYI